jgi:hypothetical protein
MSKKQGLPERGRGAPYLYGDLTAEADISGRQPHAFVSGRILTKSDVAAAPPRRPLHRFLMGMRPAAIGACRRPEGLCDTLIVKKAAA